MSWAFSGVGKPERVAAAIDKAIESYQDQSRKEFEDAAPHLKALLAINVGPGLMVDVIASGHASFDGNGAKTYGNCTVQISPLNGFVE